MTSADGDRLDVLVVGAGPTGLTLAAQLQACGTRVGIVDRQLDWVHESRALAVQPRTLEVLRGLGVAEDLVARGNDAAWVQLHTGGRVVRIRLFRALAITDEASPFALRSTRNRPRRAMHQVRSLASPRAWRQMGVADIVKLSVGRGGVLHSRAASDHEQGLSGHVTANLLVSTGQLGLARSG